MSHKFLKLIESAVQKMTNGGMLVGSLVTGLVPGYKSKESFKSLSDSVQQYIEDLFTDNDLNKKIINIKTEMPSSAAGNTDNRGTSFSAEVAVELAAGLMDKKNAVTIPSDLLVVGDGNPVPDSVKYDNKVQIKPKEVEENEEEQQTMTQQGDKLKKSDLSNPTSNTKLSESYTARYIK
jgi:hypothetical protein